MWVILLYGLIILGMAGLAIIFYLRAVRSRKRYRCPQCGEAVSTEHMEAQRCNTCGAELRREA